MTLFEFSCQLTRVQAALIKHGVEEEKRLAILDEITKWMIQQIENGGKAPLSTPPSGIYVVPYEP
jgi:hypothetical protein